MKALLCSLLILMAFAMNAQTDTVMMNERFENSDQLYKISSLQDASNDMLTSVALSVVSSGLFVASSLFYAQAGRVTDAAVIEQNESVGRALLICGAATTSFSLFFGIRSVFRLKAPTTIKPVKAL